jgi:hypothetical protein
MPNTPIRLTEKFIYDKHTFVQTRSKIISAGQDLISPEARGRFSIPGTERVFFVLVTPIPQPFFSFLRSLRSLFVFS